MISRKHDIEGEYIYSYIKDSKKLWNIFFSYFLKPPLMYNYQKYVRNEKLQ